MYYCKVDLFDPPVRQQILRSPFTESNSCPYIVDLHWHTVETKPSQSDPRHGLDWQCGLVREGSFIRMFNAMFPWDHKSNRILGDTVPYESFSCGSFADIIEHLCTHKLASRT